MNGLGAWVWEANERRWSRGPLSYASNTAFLAVSETAYFAYMGFVTTDCTPKYVRFLVRNVGVGAQVAEVGLYSSPLTPQGAAQTLTKLVATGTVDDLTTLGKKGNTSAFSTVVSAGTHLWAGVRFVMATTQPRLLAYVWDGGVGAVVQEFFASALTSVSSHTPAKLADGDLLSCPVLSVELD